MALGGVGGRAGKLLKDPAFWYPVNAIIDGLDPWSDSPLERAKYSVYQQRLYVDAMKAQAWMVAAANPEKAGDALKKYLDVALPVDPLALRMKEQADARRVEDIANMGPIDPSTIRFGNVPPGTVNSSMSRAQDHATSHRDTASSMAKASDLAVLRVPRVTKPEDVTDLTPSASPQR